MKNRIDELLTKLKDEQGVTVTEFAARCKLPPTTIYNARKREDIGKITVDVFLKIAHGLGMTAEELYYGTEREAQEQPSISPDEQTVLDGYRAVDESAKRRIRRDIRGEVEDANADAREKKEAI